MTSPLEPPLRVTARARNIGFSDGLSLPKRQSRFQGELRRSTLVGLRWMAVIGQVVAVILVSEGLGFDFPIWSCVIAIMASAFLNLAVTAGLPLDRRVGDKEAIAHLAFDTTQLSVLLWLTGGMTNPFSLLFLAPVVTSATTLNKTVLATISLLAAGLSFTLLFFHMPLPWRAGETISLPFIFLLGLWVAHLTGMFFISLYAWRTASESRRMSQALAATEAVLAQEQKLSALGGLAAAAAHELGTPLATIQLTAKEMVRALPERSELGEDAQLMHAQANRCRDILQQLAFRGDEGDLIHDQMRFEDLINEALSPFEGFGPEIQREFDPAPPIIARRAELIYGLKNFIENAMDFAYTKVVVSAVYSDSDIRLVIRDDGPGFDPAIRARLGEPYVSTRMNSEQAGGLGLGVFIAKTLIERTKARIRFYNDRKNGGAVIDIVWPRKALEIKRGT